MLLTSLAVVGASPSTDEPQVEATTIRPPTTWLLSTAPADNRLTRSACLRARPTRCFRVRWRRLPQQTPTPKSLTLGNTGAPKPSKAARAAASPRPSKPPRPSW